MANRMKEDEKNEKIIRGLLKLPPNRRCINCNNLGPQYVCTNFWTFICTNCSGMHREFTHRVKSVSMAKFTSQEVIALQEGGNERAKLIYFKEWDPQRHSFPDSSNIDRIREFIKHVYVDRRYTGERGTDRPPRVKSDREDSNENRRADSYHGSSRSPPYEDRYDRRERLSSGGRNDETNFRYGYDDRSPVHAHGDYKRSPGHFEGVDERHRDEKIGNGNQNQRIEDRRFPDAAQRASGRSPNYQKGVDSTSPPMVRPVRDILGDDVPPLRVGDIPKPNGAGVSENSSKTQRTASSSSLGSSDGNPVELKRPNFGSLIDFDVDPEPPVSSTQQNVQQQTFSPPSSSDNWASFDIAPQQKASQTSANASSIESSLDQLSTPGIVPAGNVLAPPVSDVHTFSKNNDARQLPVLQQNQPNFLAVGDTRSLVPPSDASMVNSLTWGPSVAPNMHITLTTPAGQPSQGPTAPAGEVGTRVLSQPPAETKPIGRKQLPEDLFTSIYSSAATPFPGWQRPPHPGMGYSMQYPVGAAMQTYSQPPPSINPFDLVNEPSLPHASSFPSMASLQGALPSMTGNAPLLRSASFGAPPTQYMPPQQPPYPLPPSPSPYLVQHGMTNTAPQAPSHSFPMVNHGVGFGGAGAAFGATGMEQLSGARHSQPGTPSSFAGGNPFG